MMTTDLIHPDLLIAQKQAYQPSGLQCTNIVPEKENQEYGGCEFTINNRIVKFRVAKITPKKGGLFVTFWKRSASGLTVPFDIADPFDLLVISVRKETFCGQFVFPKSVLHTKGFISKEEQGGKRAMRVYPPWDITESKQAKKTQLWQTIYFFELHKNESIDIRKVQNLFF